MEIALIENNTITSVTLAQLPTVLQQGHGTIWVDMTGPTDEDVSVMQNIFLFHPLAIEDTRNQQQRPKAEEYNNHIFVILNPIHYENCEADFRELDVLVGKNFIVTVHPEAEPIIEQAKQRLIHHNNVPISSSYILYVLMDAVVDGYFPFLENAGEQIERLEDDIFERLRPTTLNEIFQLKRALLNMWRIVWPQREIFNVLMHHNFPYLDQKSLQYYLRDVSDHLLWAADMINTSRDTLTGMMDLYMSSVSNRLNVVVNRLTVLAIIIGVFTVISGFYGMNFEQTYPAFNSPWGVPFVIGLMVVSAIAIIYVFRRFKLF